jgi:hypothetical protein
MRSLIGMKWPLFNSDKRFDCSPATIQGRNALISKFRNSSIMLEAPEWRPMLFDKAGTKQLDFPSSNVNRTKADKASR